MKIFFRFSMIVALMCTVFASCKDDEAPHVEAPSVVVADADKALVFSNTADEKTVAVTTNRSIEAASSETWCTPTVTVNADKSVNVTIAVPRNVNPDKRNAKVTLTTKSSSDATPATVEITVEQAGVGYTVSVADADNIANFTDAADERVIAVIANCELNVASSQAWCTPALTTKGGVTTLTIAVSKNENAVIRTATVTLSSKEDPSVKVEITVSQAVYVRERWEAFESLAGFFNVNLAMELDGTDPQQGGYSLKMTTGAGVWLLYKPYATAYDATPYNHIHFDLYIEDLTATPANINGFFEISSAGMHDLGKLERWAFSDLNLTTGWNHVKLQLGSGRDKSPDIDYSTLNYFRLAHTGATAPSVLKLDNLRFSAE